MMRNSCYTAYIVHNHQTIDSVTDYTIHCAKIRAEKLLKALNCVKNNEYAGAEILIEDTSDKFLDEETFIDRN